METAPGEAGRPSRLTGKRKILAVLLVVGAFLAVLLVKTQQSEPPAASGEPTLTAQHNDVVEDYERARTASRPVYVLFHSLTCQPCVEISANVDLVMPEYAGRVAFVNAITDDVSARELAQSFRFQYIPTSFFISRDGEMVQSFTGVLSPDELRERLDRLVDS